MTPELEKRLQDLADRAEIRDLVRVERFARDQRHWQVMRDSFHAEAHIRSSWFDGSAEDYVPATQRFMQMSPHSKHWVFPGFIRLNGDRATVESPATIFNRITVAGVEVDFHVYCRFFSRVERRGGPWKLMSFEVIFERDMLRPVDPAQAMPVDRAVLATYRPSYKFLTYVQEIRGVRVNPDLFGDDRPEALAKFHAGEDRWLAGED